MAKSSRSKIKRANRAVKREKNSKKELAKLEKLVELAKGSEETCAEEGKEYTVLGGAEEAMAVDDVASQNPQTDPAELEDLPMGVGLKTKSGSYPIWMNKRAIKRAKIVEKRKTRQKNKAKRVGSRPWRK